jgi:hypothetical protein
VDGAAVWASLACFEARALLPVQRGEDAMRSMTDKGRRQPDENDRGHHESCEVSAAPHPAFGHLLPAGGEKGARFDSVAAERINADLSGADANLASARRPLENAGVRSRATPREGPSIEQERLLAREPLARLLTLNLERAAAQN